MDPFTQVLSLVVGFWSAIIGFLDTRMSVITEVFRPNHAIGLLTIISAFGVRELWFPELPTKEVITIALAATGAGGLLYSSVKAGKKLKDGGTK